MSSIINIGLDAGSTTIKVAVLDADGKLLFKNYRRHHADIPGVLAEMFKSVQKTIGETKVHLTLTGSAGMGIAERCSLPFIQEVVASCGYISKEHPEIRTLVDIGGEDAKMIFFREDKIPDIRMNGNCAGGTGSFIDQMATILGVDVNELNNLAERAITIYPIASRCGVFSKTDVQNLLSRNVGKDDIAASVFHAVSIQILTSLSRGYDVLPKLFLCGGPFHFIPELRKAFIDELKMEVNDIVISENSEIVPAWGAAINASKSKTAKTLAQYVQIFEEASKNQVIDVSKRLHPLFKDTTDFKTFQESKSKYQIKQTTFDKLKSNECYIGIDSGSTTTKIVAIDSEGQIFYHFYEKNQGLSLNTVAKGLSDFYQMSIQKGRNLMVAGSCVTGYGEDLLKKAFNMENGIVETIAHYTAAYHFEPNVSFILDIGGQDMKAAFIENGTIKRLEINEACSSGCGSFIETFAQGLNYNVTDFSKVAGNSKNPCDLGTRCTVFMNSKVKQFLREGANVADISAGLSYSIVKNCLNKVLKLRSFEEMGDYVMVQGGTFRNQALIRAFELETGKNVIVSNFPELMGAYGAALFSIKKAEGKAIPLKAFVKVQAYTNKRNKCKGCENQCTITHFTFDNGKSFFAGNKCEKMVSNLGKEQVPGVNLYTEKYKLLFDRDATKEKKEGAITIGIPRSLGIFEDYPFWFSLFTNCGFNVQLSDKSTMKLYETGIKTVMADNICFPAKITNGHILNLIHKKVDRIFLPFVVYEKKEDKNTINSYNCPIVTGYSEVIRSAIDPAGKFGIAFDSPSFTFKNEKLKKKACIEYIQSLPGKTLGNKEIEKAYYKAVEEQDLYEKTITRRCNEVLKEAKEKNHLVVLLAGRPYHSDPLIQHKLADVIASYGADVITEDIVRESDSPVNKVQSIMQWAYTNRILKSASWAAEAVQNVHYIELTSFGCGPDAFIIDEISDILHHSGKSATFLKIDDINNIGSMRLRIRSLMESLKYNAGYKNVHYTKSINTNPFLKIDRKKTILLPWFADFYSPFLPPAFKLAGYNAINLPPSDRKSVEYGLKYSNNEICYPATLIVGDFMKALDSGKYKSDEIALAISQTGGQCRATNYTSLLKKALVTAGLEQIPIITIAMGGGANEQPGFKVDWKKIYKIIVYSIVYADLLSQMYYSTAPREKEKGAAMRIKNELLQLGIKAFEDNDPKRFLDLASLANQRFTEALELKDVPKIGVVGEIYVKYNSFGHKDIVNWLVQQGIETVLPPILNFFTSTFVSQSERESGNISKRVVPKYIYNFAENYIYTIVHKMEERVKAFPYFRPFETPEQMGKAASKIINLNAQFGEGWSIPAEYAHFAESGINSVVSLQPFGCIANQIISKGIEKRTRELYPNLNLLFIDFDSGMSEANILNRLHFMIENRS